MMVGGQPVVTLARPDPGRGQPAQLHTEHVDQLRLPSQKPGTAIPHAASTPASLVNHAMPRCQRQRGSPRVREAAQGIEQSHFVRLLAPNYQRSFGEAIRKKVRR